MPAYGLAVTSGELTRIALGGDVMIGRGVDQIMSHPGDPTLYETWARSALRYVELADESSGRLPRGVDPAYVWGDSPARLERLGAGVRIINLETAVTHRGKPWPHKGIHYRVHPHNADCLVAGGISGVTLANNHILDWAEPGLEDTLDTLDEIGMARTGAGRDAEEAWQPATITTRRHTRRVIVLGVTTPSSGVDPGWAAEPGGPGVALLEKLSESEVERIGLALQGTRQAGDATVVSIHWGPNWGYRIPEAHRRFARDLIDQARVDVVHGHSSHHPMGFEVYQDRLILYGCGDLLTDYEGIGGHEEFRSELGAWYDVGVGPGGVVEDLRIIPTKVHRFQLTTPAPEEIVWMNQRFREQSTPLGIDVMPGDDFIQVDW